MPNRTTRSDLCIAAASAALVLSAGGCAQNVRTEASDGRVGGAPTTVRVTDNGNALLGSITYHAEGNVVVSEIDAPVVESWPHLLSAYEHFGFDSVGRDPGNLTAGVQEIQIRRRLADRPVSAFMDCGRNMTGSLADRATIQLTLITHLVELPEGRTQVRSEMSASATDNDGTSRRSLRCSSNQRLEVAIAQRMVETLGIGG